MSRWWLLVVALGAAGCYRVPDDSCAIRCGAGAACPNGLTCGTDNLCTSGIACNQLTQDAPDRIDAPAVDAPIAPDGTTCYGAGLVVYCPPALPPSLTITTGVNERVDTSLAVGSTLNCTEIIATAGGVEVCVVAADIVTIDGTLTATGARPLVLFGRTRVQVSGLVNLSAGGAGASKTCSSMPGTEQQTVGGIAGGGAGGSLRGSGGQGGAAGLAMHAPPGPTIGLPLGTLRGGCAGGEGGRNLQLVDGGLPGAGGGAVYVLSGGPLLISGSINASGGGGRAGGMQALATGTSGGGGGGSGGVIVLEAPSIALQAGGFLVAEGGGGGGGSNNVAGEDGHPPLLASPMLRARGGTAGGAASGAGGAGSGEMLSYGLVGEDATAGGGSGGGGGGSGLIRILSGTISASGTVSPPL